MAMNVHNERKHVYLVMLVTVIALICIFTTSFAGAVEPQPIIVADLFGDLQQRLEKSARDVIHQATQQREIFTIPLQRGDKIAYISYFGEGECRVRVKSRTCNSTPLP